MEVSLDSARSWRLANIKYAEDRYREAPEQKLFGGTLDVAWRESCFCWCFWRLRISLEELRSAADLVVRAMDESMNTQPRDLYWSVLGHVNNPWYRVVIHSEEDSLKFEHPTSPALDPGGWMERVRKAGGNLANGFWGESLIKESEKHVVGNDEEVEIKMTKDGVENRISLEELRDHDNENAPWVVLHGEVYDGFMRIRESS